jgi:membrane associated rhomboid family serine protease
VIPFKDNIPTDRLPIVTILLIVANAIVYFALQHGGIGHGPDQAEVIRWGAIPYEFSHYGRRCGLVETVGGTALACGRAGLFPSQPATWVTVFSSMFMHASIIHLAGNMLFLWVFGNNVEDSMGRIRFIVFYLLGGLAAVALQIAIAPGSAIPTIGASGAIAGVLGGYIVLYPRARVWTWIFIVILPLPALVVLGLWFLQQALFGLYNLNDPTGGGGVAYYAHIGGFVFGLMAIRLFARRRKPVPAGGLPPALSGRRR